MNSLLVLIPVALVLGAIGLAAFLWALRSGQFEDLDGAAHRILFDDDPPHTPPSSQLENKPKSKPGQECKVPSDEKPNIQDKSRSPKS